MSSPIAISSRSVSPDRVGITGYPSSPSGLYVPVHRRTPSSSPSSPSSPLPPQSLPSRVYTPAALLALQAPALTPALKAEIHARISAACPEVLANARVRRSAAFHMRRLPTAAASDSAPQPVSTPAPTSTLSPAPVQSPPPTQRSTPRRTRPAGRGPERRRAALQLAENWRVPARSIATSPVAVL